METVVRVAFIYLFILVMLRVMGKRELSQLSPLELIMLILIPELVAQSLVREDFSMTNAIIAVTTLMSLVFVTSVLVYRFRWFGRLVEGQPAILVDHGRMIGDALDRERVPPEELAAEMRKAGIERLEDVKWAVLETGGDIAIIGFRSAPARPAPESEPLR